MHWQPIETAPKDGVFVLVHNPKWIFGWAICAYNDHFNEWETEESGIVSPAPTHWMPLPELPTD